jgi:hypothetical protein
MSSIPPVDVVGEEATEATEKCSFRSCKVKGAVKHVCAANDCSKLCHKMCFQGLLLNKQNLPPLPGGGVVCTKKCYAKAQKELSGGGEDQEGGRQGKWDSDGKNGPEDTHTSMRILLDWWTIEGNYSKFCGKHNDGVKKKQFAAALATKMTAETSSKRDSKNVLNKIQHIEKKWREAHNFATSETGAGILESDGATSFEELVKGKCPYYYELLEVMQDRASTAPKVTNYAEDEFAEGSVSSFGNDDAIGNDDATASATTSSGKKVKRPPKMNPHILDDESLAMLKGSVDINKQRMEEEARHNKVMEKIELQKAKRNQLDYTMDLLVRFETMKSKGWSNKKILRLIPDMREIIEAQEMDSSESE